jgi:hypothetical protein
VKLWLLRAVVPISWLALVRPLGPAVLASAAMAVVLLALTTFTSALGSAGQAAAGVAVGALVYGSSLWLLDRRSIVRVGEVFRQRDAQAVGLVS